MSALDVIAQVQIDFTLDAVIGPSFGFNLASFAVLVVNQSYSINLDEDSQVSNLQRQVLVSRRVSVGFPVAEGPLTCLPLPGPPIGIAIQSTNILGVPAPSLFIHQLTFVRIGAVS